MTYTVVVTERAAKELEETTAWWARERSTEQAFRWYSKIRAKIETLAQHPQRCGLAAESQDFHYELRELHFGVGSKPTHRVLFTIAATTVVVLTVRHVAQSAVQPRDLE